MENREILSLFGTLPNVPLSSIVKYLNVPQLIMIALQFPEWKEFCFYQIQKIIRNTGKDQYLSLNVSNDVLEIGNHSCFRRNTFSVSLKVNAIEEEFCCYRREEEKEKEGENANDGTDLEDIKESIKDQLFIDCKNENVMEELYVNIFHLIHPSSIESVTMKANESGKIERLKLLKRINTGQTVKGMVLLGRKNVIVDGNELNSVIEAPKEIDSLTVRDAIPRVEFNYGNNLRELVVFNGINRDGASEMLTTEYMKKINCRSYHALWNIYAPEHVNAFLRNWMSGGNENVRDVILALKNFPPWETLSLNSPGNEEDLQKIFEGLDAKEWDPERREARFIEESTTPYSLFFVDLSRSKDIVRLDGTVATIWILLGRFVRFFVWTDRFPWRNQRESYEQRLVECEEFLAQYDKNLLAEVYKEMYDESLLFTDSDCYEESSERRKIMDELVIQERIKRDFERYADYLSTFND